MKQWLSIFSAVLLAGAVLFAYSRWVDRWELAADRSAAMLIRSTERSNNGRYQLPDPDVARMLAAEVVLLDSLVRDGERHLNEHPPGAGRQFELKSAVLNARNELRELQKAMALPGNALATTP